MSPLSLGLAAAAVAVLELDVTLAGQFLVSRPMVFSPLLGLVLHAPETGAAVGLICELLSLEELPVGGHLPLNATVAAGGALLLAAGCSLPLELALPAGLALGWLHGAAEGVLRRRRAALSGLVEERLGRGEEPGLGALAGREAAVQAAMTFGILVLGLLAAPPLLAAWQAAPGALRGGLRFSLAMSPWLGIAALLYSLRWKRALAR